MRRATRNISLTLLLVLWPTSAFALLGVGDKAPALSISDWVKLIFLFARRGTFLWDRIGRVGIWPNGDR